MEDETTLRLTVQFKAAVSLAAVELLPPAAVTEQAMHLAAAWPPVYGHTPPRDTGQSA